MVFQVTELTPCETENPMGGGCKTCNFIQIEAACGKPTLVFQATSTATPSTLSHTLWF